MLGESTWVSCTFERIGCWGRKLDFGLVLAVVGYLDLRFGIWRAALSLFLYVKKLSEMGVRF